MRWEIEKLAQDVLSETGCLCKSTSFIHEHKKKESHREGLAFQENRRWWCDVSSSSLSLFLDPLECLSIDGSPLVIKGTLIEEEKKKVNLFSSLLQVLSFMQDVKTFFSHSRFIHQNSLYWFLSEHERRIIILRESSHSIQSPKKERERERENIMITAGVLSWKEEV